MKPSTADTGEAGGQNAATEVGPEVLLDPAGETVAERVFLGRPGRERLEVVLDDGAPTGIAAVYRQRQPTATPLY